jgi:hypothetical protein
VNKLLEDWQEAYIASAYSKGVTTIELQDLFQCSNTLIYNVLKDKNIPRKTGGLEPPLFDHSYFDLINDEYKAYFLGLIIADGSVCQTKRGGQKLFQLELKEEDSYLIESLAKDLNWPLDRIRTYKRFNRNPTTKISIYSNRLADSLATHGVIANKSTTSYLPQIETSLMRHLLRGLFDGDGSIGKYRLTLVAGNINILNQVKDYFINALSLNKDALKIYQTGLNTWTLSINRKLERNKIITFLYNSVSIAMLRKAHWLGN